MDAGPSASGEEIPSVLQQWDIKGKGLQSREKMAVLPPPAPFYFAILALPLCRQCRRSLFSISCRSFKYRHSFFSAS